MENLITVEELESLIDQRMFVQLRTVLCEMNEIDAAALIGELSSEKALRAFRTLPKEMASDVFSYFTTEQQRTIIHLITDKELSAIVEDLYIDDVVDMLEELPANVVKRVLKSASSDTRALINQFLKYPEDSAGGLMTAEFTDLRAQMTITDAIEHIRETGEDSETIYTCYVTDDSRHLEGYITVKDLLLAKDNSTVREHMDENVISVHTLCDREEAARLMQRYDLMVLPVVDEENRLVGIITIDDALTVIQEETNEDFEVMGAMHPSETPYLQTSVFALAKNRIVWLLVLMVSGMLTGWILARYEAAFSALPVLVSFIPMLTGTGGNAGSQSSTLVIRGIATGDIQGRDVVRVLWKEVRVAAMVGVVMSVVNYIRLVITYPGQEMLALVVALTMFCTVLMAKTIGGILPIIAKAVHADPAIMAAPLISTIVDALSLILYFTIASHLLEL